MYCKGWIWDSCETLSFLCGLCYSVYRSFNCRYWYNISEMKLGIYFVKLVIIWKVHGTPEVSLGNIESKIDLLLLHTTHLSLGSKVTNNPYNIIIKLLLIFLWKEFLEIFNSIFFLIHVYFIYLTYNFGFSFVFYVLSCGWFPALNSFCI